MRKLETRARATDPQTSFEAAMHVAEPSKLRASQARVLNMFKLYGDLHDKALLAYLNDAERNAGLTPMSPSGARSRRSELAKPNMDRLDELAADEGACDVGPGTWGRLPRELRQVFQDRLRAEGFRSPLWDTGKREKVDGHTVIVWGIAR